MNMIIRLTIGFHDWIAPFVPAIGFWLLVLAAIVALGIAAIFVMAIIEGGDGICGGVIYFPISLLASIALFYGAGELAKRTGLGQDPTSEHHELDNCDTPHRLTGSEFDSIWTTLGADDTLRGPDGILYKKINGNRLPDPLNIRSSRKSSN